MSEINWRQGSIYTFLGVCQEGKKKVFIARNDFPGWPCTLPSVLISFVQIIRLYLRLADSSQRLAFYFLHQVSIFSRLEINQFEMKLPRAFIFHPLVNESLKRTQGPPFQLRLNKILLLHRSGAELLSLPSPGFPSLVDYMWGDICSVKGAVGLSVGSHTYFLKI